MIEGAAGVSWQDRLMTGLLVFLIAFAGTAAVFTFWLQDLLVPQVTFLGSGNQLSLLVTDGPARLLLATGNSPIAYENAITRVRPLFARRIDVLLVAGAGEALYVPIAAAADPHVRSTRALAPLPESAEADALEPIAAFPSPRKVQLGPSVQVTVETALPVGADPETVFPAWRATIERGETRVVVLSDGLAGALFPPAEGASVLAVSGGDPAVGWDLSPGVAFVANAEAISGPEMRSAFAESRRPPEWGFRVFPGEALRLKFVTSGVELPSPPAQSLAGPSPSAVIRPDQPGITQRVRRRASPSHG